MTGSQGRPGPQGPPGSSGFPGIKGNKVKISGITVFKIPIKYRK
jgi:hypothetical protein